MKPKYVDEWNLSSNAKEEVKKQLKAWYTLFKKRAKGHTGNVRIVNFKDNKLFYFTDCRDILSDKSLKPKERELKERRRKRNILMQLFLNELVTGKTTKFNGVCTHCGGKKTELIPLGMAGYVTFCKDCNRTVIDTYVPSMKDAVDILYKKLQERKIDMEFEK